MPAFERLEFGVGEALLRERHRHGHRDAAWRRCAGSFVEVGDYGTLVATLFAGRPAGRGQRGRGVRRPLRRGHGQREGRPGAEEGRDRRAPRRCGPQEAKHVVRIILGRLRLGIGDPTVMDALSFARTESKADRKALERAYNLCSDLGLVAAPTSRGRVEGLQCDPRPGGQAGAPGPGRAGGRAGGADRAPGALRGRAQDRRLPPAGAQARSGRGRRCTPTPATWRTCPRCSPRWWRRCGRRPAGTP